MPVHQCSNSARQVGGVDRVEPADRVDDVVPREREPHEQDVDNRRSGMRPERAPKGARSPEVFRSLRVAPVPEDEPSVLQQPCLPHLIRVALEGPKCLPREGEVDVGLADVGKDGKTHRLRSGEIGAVQTAARTIDLLERRANIPAVGVDPGKQPAGIRSA